MSFIGINSCVLCLFYNFWQIYTSPILKSDFTVYYYGLFRALYSKSFLDFSLFLFLYLLVLFCGCSFKNPLNFILN